MAKKYVQKVFVCWDCPHLVADNGVYRCPKIGDAIEPLPTCDRDRRCPLPDWDETTGTAMTLGCPMRVSS